MTSGRLSVGLIHHPVVDKNGREIASAITPTDLHDLARSARTYGVETFWVVTPLKDQRKLASRMLGFWQKGVGAGYNPNRGQALDLVRIVPDLATAIGGQTEAWSERPLIWATSAIGPRETGSLRDRFRFETARAQLAAGKKALVLFGTAWGLAPRALEGCDDILEPINGAGEYNHLSVRSAAAVVLDRLLGAEPR